jgi:DHA2 family multidrug resistance protein-like MFS transporter
LIIGSAPPERAGAAAGISETSAEFNGALGIAVFGSIGVAIYRRLLGDTSIPGAPPEAIEAAMDTLGGAVVAASELPPQAGGELLDAARDAFMAGIHACAALSTLGSLAMAAFVYAKLRGVAKTSTTAGAPPSASAE